MSYDLITSNVQYALHKNKIQKNLTRPRHLKAINIYLKNIIQRNNADTATSKNPKREKVAPSCHELQSRRIGERTRRKQNYLFLRLENFNNVFFFTTFSILFLIRAYERYSKKKKQNPLEQFTNLLFSI